MGRIREFEIQLEEPIGAAVDGIYQDECKDVILVAPNSKHRRSITVLKSLSAKASQTAMEHWAKIRAAIDLDDDTEKEIKQKIEEKKQAESAEGEKKEEKVKASEILESFYTNLSEDEIDRAFDAFRTMLKGGCGSLSGTVFTDNLLDDLSYTDTERLFGEYVANFLSSSPQS